jgi:hypothetical protein
MIPPLPFGRGEGRAFAAPERLRPRRRGEGFRCVVYPTDHYVSPPSRNGSALHLLSFLASELNELHVRTGRFWRIASYQ